MSPRAYLAGWLLAGYLPLNALAQSSDAAVSLAVKAAHLYALGEPIEVSLVLTNRGTKPIAVFRPRSPQLQWADWSIGCPVTSPTGRAAELVPTILFSRVPLPVKSDVVTLQPGETSETVLILGSQDLSTPPLSEQALVLALAIPLSQAEEEMTEGPLRQHFGIKGRFTRVSGGEPYLEVADVAGKVFDSLGSYQLECRFSSAIIDVWVPGEGNSLVVEAVEGLFVGEVSGVAEVSISDRDGQADR